MIQTSTLTNKIYYTKGNEKIDITKEAIDSAIIMLLEGVEFNNLIKSKKDGKHHELCVKEYEVSQ